MLPALVRLSLSTISLLSASLARATGLSAVLVSPNHVVRNAVPSRVGVIIATEIFRRPSGTPGAREGAETRSKGGEASYSEGVQDEGADQRRRETLVRRRVSLGRSIKNRSTPARGRRLRPHPEITCSPRGGAGPQRIFPSPQLVFRATKCQLPRL
jgi:hypothetical protein